MASLLWFYFIATILHPSTSIKQTYIIQIKHHQKPSSYPTNHHLYYSQVLQSLTSATPDDILYSYTTAYHGFSASLHPHQAQALRDSDSVLGVYEDSVYQLQTTRSPHFLGIDKDLGFLSRQQLDHAASDVIIGLVDTGVWPELKSFDDSGMPDVPAWWRGECEEAEEFKATVCNKKLIGARMFYKGFTSGEMLVEKLSPRDYTGHGTHTSTTAAGAPVGNASLFGYANGTARGIAVHARLASYKACWEATCYGSDMLAAIDKAISDGVDVLSMSVGGKISKLFYELPLAVGTFKAMEMGIFVSFAAGNWGPEKASVANEAPWTITVGASSIDRSFPAYVLLGNGKRLPGVSLYSINGKGMGDKPVELVYPSGNRSNLCIYQTLKPDLVHGKVVLCDWGLVGNSVKGTEVKVNGGIGMIVANTASRGEEVTPENYLLPAVTVGRKVGDEIREYLKTEAKPTALLTFGGTVLGVKPSPMVASFSSRGPNKATPQILKPDVIAPGVNILAGWSAYYSANNYNLDPRRSDYNIKSGTSIACPHVSGLAALLKAAHPDWSPSAIKSALMTTAYPMDNTNSPIREAVGGVFSTPWHHGAGHVDLHKAMSPGLLYDISTSEYIAFICSLSYTMKQVEVVVNRPNVNCTKKFNDPGQLNYPSFSVVFGKSRVVRYTRRLTNVGAAGSVYKVDVVATKGVDVIVKPKRLVFKNTGQMLQYTVKFMSRKDGDNERNGAAFGSITWKNMKNQVRSPVGFSWDGN